MVLPSGDHTPPKSPEGEAVNCRCRSPSIETRCRSELLRLPGISGTVTPYNTHLPSGETFGLYTRLRLSNSSAVIRWLEISALSTTCFVSFSFTSGGRGLRFGVVCAPSCSDNASIRTAMVIIECLGMIDPFFEIQLTIFLKYMYAMFFPLP